MSRYKRKTNRVDWLSPDEVLRLMALPRGKAQARDTTMLRVLWHTGMRIGELVGMDTDDILWATATLRIEWEKHGGERTTRMIPVSPEALAALRGYLDGRAFAPGPVFLGPSGRRISMRAVEFMVKRLGAKVTERGIVTPHTLRHSFATRWIERGGSVVALQHMMGHESLATTQGYIHASGEFVRRDYDAVMAR
jgi:integrase/recombinase XerC